LRREEELNKTQGEGFMGYGETQIGGARRRFVQFVGN